MRFRLVFGPLLIALALGLAACGGDDSDGGTGGDETPVATQIARSETPAQADGETPTPALAAVDLGDACSLVTAAEISEIAGEEFGEGKLNSNDCTYVSVTNREVTISLEDHGSQAKSQFDDNVDVLKMEEVAGIGEAAAWTDRFGELDILEGSKIIIVSAPFIDASDKKAAAVAIAEKALD